jgi:Iron-sulfur cluster-binding domain
VFSTLYGMSELDADLVIELLRKHSQQIVAVCLHLPDANGNMPGWKYSKNWENVFKKFKGLMEENILQSFSIMTMDGSGVVHKDLHHLNLRILPWHGHTRAGSLDETNVEEQSIYTQTPHNTTPVSCADTPFYDQNVVLPNGDVLLCCMDYGMKHVIGNLLRQDYYDLFAGLEMNRLRRINMTPGFSDCSICKSCDRTLNYDLSPSVTWTASGDPLAHRDATIAEYRYHLDRINASPWWRFGIAITNFMRGRRAGN